ncbi:MAG: glucosamine-6-phosphate deaminase [Fidelibacterota bacterium]
MLVIVKDDFETMSKEAARIVVDRLRKKPNLVLGLATGSTPLGLYEELVRLHNDEGLDFSQVITFNLDEYVGLRPDHDQSYHYFMWKNLFDHINVNPANVHIPQGMFVDAAIDSAGTDPMIETYCKWYEEEIWRLGGLDLQILGIGSNGHIAFNEPGSSLGSRTRIKTLTEKTRQDNSRFFDSIEEVPRYAITMGIGTIMDAREVILLASGKEKAEAVEFSVEGPITAMCPASMLQMHRKAIVIIDKEAATELTGKFAYYG